MAPWAQIGSKARLVTTLSSDLRRTNRFYSDVEVLLVVVPRVRWDFLKPRYATENRPEPVQKVVLFAHLGTPLFALFALFAILTTFALFCSDDKKVRNRAQDPLYLANCDTFIHFSSLFGVLRDLTTSGFRNKSDRTGLV